MRIYISDLSSDLGCAVSESLASPAVGETSSISDHLNGEFDAIIELSGSPSSLSECVNLAKQGKDRTVNLVLVAESVEAFNRSVAVMINFPWPPGTRVNIFNYDRAEPDGLDSLCQSIWWHLYSAQKGREFSHQLYFDDGCETEFDGRSSAVQAAWEEIAPIVNT